VNLAAETLRYLGHFIHLYVYYSSFAMERATCDCCMLQHAHLSKEPIPSEEKQEIEESMHCFCAEFEISKICMPCIQVEI